MAEDKKNMYELLGITPNASVDEIHAAHAKATAQLDAQVGQLSQDDIDIKRKVLDWSLHTLTNPRLRADYDARHLAAPAAAPEAMPAQTPIYVTAVPERRSRSPLNIILSIIAGLFAVGLAIQVGFMFLAYRTTAEAVDGPVHIDGASPIEEKVILQEYYQEHGVRAGSRIEAELLTKTAQREEQEKREKEQAKAEEERKYQRFLEESRRIGDEASAARERVEEMARREAEQKSQLQSDFRQDEPIIKLH